MRHGWLRVLAWVALLACVFVARAHESRPAYLQVDDLGQSRYSVLWRTPINAGMRLPVRLVLPEGAVDLAPPAVRDWQDSRIERRLIEVPGGLAGQRIVFDGLQGTITDVLVRIRNADGTESSTLVHPSNATFRVPTAPRRGDVARTYTAYGVQHILGGIDHLLFVFGLLLIVRGGRRIVATVTAFTVAHSLTLAAATLGWVRVPVPAVEAIIALSIVFVAVEIVRGWSGRPGLTSRAPWVVAFCFGLLHGFGFAGALAEVGLPERAIPMALLCFNVGVEIGQLLFVGVVLAAMALLRRLPMTLPRWAPLAAPYAIGGVASFWMLQRILSFWD